MKVIHARRRLPFKPTDNLLTAVGQADISFVLQVVLKGIDMTHTSRRLLLAALFATSGTVALAQTPPPASASDASTPPAAGKRHGHMNKDPAEIQQRMAEHHERHMTDLKALLKITPEQEGAWNTYAAAMKPPQPQRMSVSRAEFDKLTTPERLDLMQKHRTERDAQIKQRSDATRAFYAQLAPQQQQAFDTQMRRFGPHAGEPDHQRGHRH